MRSERRVQKDEWYKDRSNLREQDSATVQSRANKAFIKDYSLKHKVSIEWDMTPDSINDRICILRVDDYAAVIDHDEILRALRFV